MANEPTGPGVPGGGNQPGLVDLAKGATAPAPGEKRGRGRPPGPARPGGAPAPRPVAELPVPGVATLPPFIWTAQNAGALTRPCFSIPAFVLGIKELKLSPEEEAELIPAMIPLYQEFFPYMSPKVAAAIGALATLAPIVGSKVKIYLDAGKAKKAAAVTTEKELREPEAAK